MSFWITCSRWFTRKNLWPWQIDWLKSKRVYTMLSQRTTFCKRWLHTNFMNQERIHMRSKIPEPPMTWAPHSFLGSWKEKLKLYYPRDSLNQGENKKNEWENYVQPRKKNPLTACILDDNIVKCLDKPLKFHSYNRNREPNKHIDNMDKQLNYYHTDSDVKCNLFALTLTESTQV